jgi:hypothetical protein
MQGIREMAIAAGIALALGGAGGWMVNGWRLGVELERRAGVIDTQKESLELLGGANKRCDAGAAAVRGSLAAFYGELDRRSARVEAALEVAGQAAQAHQEAARHALGRALPEAGQECARAASEARAYAAKRKEEGGQ